MIEAAHAIEAAQTDQESTNKRPEHELLGLLVKEHGADRVRRFRGTAERKNLSSDPRRDCLQLGL